MLAGQPAAWMAESLNYSSKGDNWSMNSGQELSRSREIVDVITSGIKRGTFLPGERLPSQVEMAQLFGVSRTVVREAIKILEGQGIVSSKRGSGAYVNALALSALERRQEGGEGITLPLENILDMGRQLWYYSLERVAVIATQEEIDALYRMTHTFYNRFNEHTAAKERYIYETSFGLTLTKHSGNPFLHKIMVELFKVTSDVDYEVIRDAQKYNALLQIDLKIVEALQERDGQRAKFYGQERDRLIQTILDAKPELLQRTYRVMLSID